MILMPPNEILWEITPKCNKDCFYCGSKEITKNEPLKHSELINIAENIARAKNKPKEVTLTGGEPGTLKYETLYDIVTIFRSHKIKVKAVTNGTLLDVIFDNNRLLIDCFERIGLSINTKNDIRWIKDSYYKLDNITMITNFGTHNIFLFDELKREANCFGFWQVQLTEGNEYQLPPDGIELLWKKVAKVNSPYQSERQYDLIVLADNAQREHICQAGVHGCSITWEGSVIPCLSERSWNKDKKEIYGNMLKDNFDYIWEKGLEEFRTNKCNKCCRDFVKYPELNYEIETNTKKGDPIIYIPAPKSPDGPTITYYSVGTPDKTIVVYGVFKPPYEVAAYNVSGPGGTFSCSSDGTPGDKPDENKQI